MINSNQVQTPKNIATVMEHYPASHELFQKIIRLICITPDAQAMLSKIASTLGQYFQADLCLIIADTKATETTHKGYWHQNSDYQFNKTKINQILAHSLIKSMINGELIMSLNRQNQGESGLINNLLDLCSVSALLGGVTEFQDHYNGLILLGKEQPHQWTSEEKSLLKSMVELVGIANFITQNKGEITERELPASSPGSSGGLLGEKNPLLQKWYKLTRQQLEQQKQLNELKDEIITVISHEAGTPLTTMKLAIEMLYARRQETDQAQERQWKTLKDQWQRLRDLIDNITTLQELKEAKIACYPQPVDLRMIIQEMGQIFQEEWGSKKQLTLVTEGLLSSSSKKRNSSPVELHIDFQHLKRILSELLTNAGKFSQRKTRVSIEAIRPNPDTIEIKITNIGLEISAEDQEHIFEPFRRGKGMTEKAIGGTGLGLAIVKGLVELLGGTIKVISQPSDQENLYLTCFTLTLPKSQLSSSS